MDTRDTVFLEAQLREYGKGTSSGGTGPSFTQRNYRRELDQAARYGREINELGLGRTVDGESGHRPPEKCKGKNSKGKTKKKQNSKIPPTSTSSQGAPTTANNNLFNTQSERIPSSSSPQPSVLTEHLFRPYPSTSFRFPSSETRNPTIIQNDPMAMANVT